MDLVKTKLQEVANIQVIGVNQKLKEPSKSYVLDLASHLFANDVILLMSTFNSLGEKQDMGTHSNNKENYDPPLSMAIHHHLTIICSIFSS